MVSGAKKIHLKHILQWSFCHFLFFFLCYPPIRLWSMKCVMVPVLPWKSLKMKMYRPPSVNLLDLLIRYVLILIFVFFVFFPFHRQKVFYTLSDKRMLNKSDDIFLLTCYIFRCVFQPFLYLNGS